MRYLDITYPLHPGMTVWPGDPDMEIKPVLTRANGDVVNSSLVTFGSHTGTHIDAPAHVLGGQNTIEAIPLEVLIGPAVVIDCCGVSSVSAEVLRTLLPAGCKRLLVKTSVGQVNQPGSMFPYSSFTIDAAEWLVNQQVLLVGLSSPSVDSFDSEDLPVHRILLQAGVVIVERLALEGISAGKYQLYCLPLPLVGGDGSPARVILTAE
jgi:arylformamidase